MEVLSADPSLVLCYTQTVWLDQNGGREEKIFEYVDTRGLPDWLPRLNVVLWGLVGGCPIYGVFRTAALKKTSVYTQVYAPDISLLVELSMIGRFAFLPEPALKLRRASDHGDARTFVVKHFHGAERNATMLYWRMVFGLATRVSRHVRTVPGKLFAFGCVLCGMLIKFRWILGLLREVSKQPAQARKISENEEPGID
jgi:hypothetical protein